MGVYPCSLRRCCRGPTDLLRNSTVQRRARHRLPKREVAIDVRADKPSSASIGAQSPVTLPHFRLNQMSLGKSIGRLRESAVDPRVQRVP